MSPPPGPADANSDPPSTGRKLRGSLALAPRATSAGLGKVELVGRPAVLRASDRRRTKCGQRVAGLVATQVPAVPGILRLQVAHDPAQRATADRVGQRG